MKKGMMFFVLMALSTLIVGCNSTDQNALCKNRIRLEHIALNVPDPDAMAKWYCENLDMKIKTELESPFTIRFVADSQDNMMFELYNRSDIALPDYSSISPKNLHIAFMVDDVEGICKRLQAAGATVVSGPETLDCGVDICMLRDPWSVPIQFVKRDKLMLQHND